MWNVIIATPQNTTKILQLMHYSVSCLWISTAQMVLMAKQCHCMVMLISTNMIFHATNLPPFVAKVSPSNSAALNLHSYTTLQLCHTLIFNVRMSQSDKFFIKLCFNFTLPVHFIKLAHVLWYTNTTCMKHCNAYTYN